MSRVRDRDRVRLKGLAIAAPVDRPIIPNFTS